MGDFSKPVELKVDLKSLPPYRRIFYTYTCKKIPFRSHYNIGMYSDISEAPIWSFPSFTPSYKCKHYCDIGYFTSALPNIRKSTMWFLNVCAITNLRNIALVNIPSFLF